MISKELFLSLWSAQHLDMLHELMAKAIELRNENALPRAITKQNGEEKN